MRRMRNVKIIEWAMTHNKQQTTSNKKENETGNENENANENGNENVSFFCGTLPPWPLSFGHHKAYSELARHILSLLLMSKMANKNVYDTRTEAGQVNSWENVFQEALNAY